MSFLTGFSQELPKWANKAKKAVFSVITYNKDNQILNTGNGFYIDEQGTAVSDYSLFKGADHAVIVTADGKELPVKYIMGANDIYDVVKFKTEFDKKGSSFTTSITSCYTRRNSLPASLLNTEICQRTEWNDCQD